MSRTLKLAEPIQFGKYQLTELIANGRMAEVFRAKRDGVEGFEKILVVKRLYSQFSNSEPFISAFVEEAKLTVSLSHANIVQVLDLGQEADGYFMAMEHILGYDLGTVMYFLRMLQRPLSLDVAVFMISEVAKGLDYAHRRKDYNFQSLNIVHRDLCPSNVLVSFEGEVKISDFGVARALEIVGVQVGEPKRKYMYCSPEQALGEELTNKSDIYSLGLILYELISGHHPYNCDNPPIDVIRQRAEEGVLQPIGDVMELPRAMEQIIGSMLQPNPEDRVDSAGTLYEELISYLFASQSEKADNRSLSLFMQDLRLHEDTLFPNGPAPVDIGQASESFDDELELDLDDLEDIEAMSPVGDSRSTFEPIGAVADEHDVGRSPDGVQSIDIDAPAGVGEALGRLWSGEGSALCVQGSLDEGREHLLDRLPSKLHELGVLTLCCQCSEDDVSVPNRLGLKLLSDLMGIEDALQSPPSLQDLETGLTALGLDVDEAEVVRNLFGKTNNALGFHEKREQTVKLIDKLLSLQATDRPVALLIDSVGVLDQLSKDLLSHIASRSQRLPLLLFVTDKTSAQAEEGVLAWKTAEGSPTFEAVVQASQSHLEVEGVLRNLEEEGLKVLTVMALSGRPMSSAGLGGILGGDVADRGLEMLKARHALRPLSSGSVELASLRLMAFLSEQLSTGALPHVRHYAAALLSVAAPSRLLGPGRIRLLAWSGRRHEALAEALSYCELLQGGGYRAVAMDVCARTSVLFNQAGLGHPQGEIDLGLRHAELALEQMALSRSESVLRPLELKAASLGDDRRHLRVKCLLARLSALRDEEQVSLRRFTAVARSASLLGAPDILIEGRIGLGRWHVCYGSLSQAEQHIDGALSLMGRQTGQALGRYAEALELKVQVQAQMGRLKLATESQARLEQLSLTGGTHALRCQSALGRAHLARVASTVDVQALEDVEQAYKMSRLGDQVELGVRLALQVGEVAYELGDMEKTRAYGEHLKELGELYQVNYISRRGDELLSFVGVMTAKGNSSLDALQGLHNALGYAQSQGLSRDILNSHVLLHRALMHLGSIQDADFHRREALRSAAQCCLGELMTERLVGSLG